MPLENSDNSVEPNQPPEHSDSEAADHSQETKTSAPPSVAVTTTQPCSQHHEITCNAKRDWIDKATLGLEAFGLFVLIVYTIATIAIWCANKKAADAAKSAADTASSTLDQTKKSLDATIDQAHLDQRAWVTIMSGLKGEGLIFGIGQPLYIGVRLKNTGKTPALHVKANTRIQPVWHNPIPRITDETKMGPGSVLAPEGELEQGDYLAGKSPVTKEVADAILAKEYVIWVWGTVTYDDIFGVQHWTKFCFVKSFGSLTFCTTHNDVDKNKG